MSFWVLAVIIAMITLIFVSVLRTPRSPGRLSLIIAVLCGLWWTGCVIARIDSTDVDLINFMIKLAWFGVMGVPLFWTLSFVTYARGEDCEKPWQIGVLAALTVVVGIAALTNDWHYGIYGPTFDLTNSRNFHGPVYFVAMTTAYVAMGGGFLYGLVRLRTARDIHRWQLIALLLVAVLPWGANVSFNFFAVRLFNDDPTPFVFAATGAGLLATQYFARMFVLPPVGRDAIFAVLPDPVIAFDDEGRILEINPAAADLPGIPKNAIGVKLSEPPELAALVAGGETITDTERGEIRIDHSGKIYEYSYHPLTRWGRSGGRLVHLHDITLRKADETTLNALSRDLQAQLHDNMTLQRKLKDEASRDHLTGLFNRRHAYRILPRLMSAIETERSGALVVIDIDHFKSFNDRFGHDMGDKVIKTFGKILQTDPDVRDFAFRWGGEEFLVFLPHADQQAAMHRCAQWRMTLSTAKMGAPEGETLTFSAGIRVIAAGDDVSLDDAVKAADDLLYAAKRAGRDTVMASPDAVMVGGEIFRIAKSATKRSKRSAA